MTKGLWVYFVHLLCFISYVFKNLYFPILLHSFSPVLFLKQFPSTSLFACLPLFFFLCQITPTPFPQILSAIKTFLNIRTVPSSAVFCSNAVFIKTPSSSMYFFSFFDVLPSAPTTTGMTLMLLMFHILLISLFSSWFLSIFPSLFH